MNTEVLLAAGYAGLLMLGTVALERLSAVTHRRSLRYRTAGFTYHEGHDKWACPEGETLWPHEFDRDRRLVRYRARAQVCNGCQIKEACTDSDHGREIVRPLDVWPHSEAGRFHRGISLVLIGLAIFILVIEMTRHHQITELALMLGMITIGSVVGLWLARAFRLHPANFPDPTPGHGLHLKVTDARGERALEPEPFRDPGLVSAELGVDRSGGRSPG